MKVVAASIILGLILTISAFLSMGLTWLAFVVLAPVFYFFIVPRLSERYSKYWNPKVFLQVYFLSIALSILIYLLLMKVNRIPLPF